MAPSVTSTPGPTSRWRIRVGPVLIVAAAAAFVAMVFAMLARVEPIEVVNSRLDRHGDAVCVEGTVRNTGRKVGAVQLEVLLYDAQGHKLAQDRVALGSLDGGQETSFKSPLHTLSGVSDFTIAIDRGRNPYGN